MVIEKTAEYKETTRSEKQKEFKAKAWDAWLSYMFLKHRDQLKYGSLLSGLASQYSMKNDQYPATLSAASNVLTQHF